MSSVAYNQSQPATHYGGQAYRPTEPGTYYSSKPSQYAYGTGTRVNSSIVNSSVTRAPVQTYHHYGTQSTFGTSPPLVQSSIYQQPRSTVSQSRSYHLPTVDTAARNPLGPSNVPIYDERGGMLQSPLVGYEDHDASIPKHRHVEQHHHHHPTQEETHHHHHHHQEIIDEPHGEQAPRGVIIAPTPPKKKSKGCCRHKKEPAQVVHNPERNVNENEFGGSVVG